MVEHKHLKRRECEGEKKPEELSENLEETCTSEKGKRMQKFPLLLRSKFHKGRNFYCYCVLLMFILAPAQCLVHCRWTINSLNE